MKKKEKKRIVKLVKKGRRIHRAVGLSHETGLAVLRKLFQCERDQCR